MFLDFYTINQTHDMFSGAFAFQNSKIPLESSFLVERKEANLTDAFRNVYNGDHLDSNKMKLGAVNTTGS